MQLLLENGFYVNFKKLITKRTLINTFIIYNGVYKRRRKNLSKGRR